MGLPPAKALSALRFMSKSPPREFLEPVGHGQA